MQIPRFALIGFAATVGGCAPRANVLARVSGLQIPTIIEGVSRDPRDAPDIARDTLEKDHLDVASADGGVLRTAWQSEAASGRRRRRFRLAIRVEGSTCTVTPEIQEKRRPGAEWTDAPTDDPTKLSDVELELYDKIVGDLRHALVWWQPV